MYAGHRLAFVAAFHFNTDSNIPCKHQGEGSGAWPLGLAFTGGRGNALVLVLFSASLSVPLRPGGCYSYASLLTCLCAATLWRRQVSFCLRLQRGPRAKTTCPWLFFVPSGASSHPHQRNYRKPFPHPCTPTLYKHMYTHARTPSHLFTHTKNPKEIIEFD